MGGAKPSPTPAKGPQRKKREAQGVDLEATLVSINKIKVVVGAIVVVTALVIAWFFAGKSDSPESQARKEIAEAQDLSTRAATSPNLSEHKNAFEEGQANLAAAKQALASKGWDAARSGAIDAQGKFRLVISEVGSQADATFYEVEGSVQVQKGAEGTWTPARVKMALTDGDFVKTGANGSAEVRYADGQVHTIRAETLFEIKKRIDPETNTRKNQVKIVKGVIDVITTSEKSRIVTPSNVVVEQAPDTKASVEVKADNTASFSVFEGKGGTVTTAKGETVDVGNRERVSQKADFSLREKVALPDIPVLEKPVDNASLDVRTTEQVVLTWLPVSNARQYHLQVSKSRFFVQPEIDVDRTKTDATIKILAEGLYFWRVAAVGSEGTRGDFAIPRKFRLASASEAIMPGAPGGTPVAPQKAAPAISVDDSSPIGNLWLLSGHTDPGAVVTVNGEPANVDSTGKWTFSFTFKKVGLSTIIIRASNGGAEAKLTKQYNYVE